MFHETSEKTVDVMTNTACLFFIYLCAVQHIISNLVVKSKKKTFYPKATRMQ